MAILHGSWLLHPPQKQAHSGGSDGKAQTVDEGNGELAADRSSGLSSGCLFIWGETWRRITPEMIQRGGGEGLASLDPGAILPHPFALTAPELLSFLRSLHNSGQLQLPAALLEASLAPAGKSGKRSRRATAAGTDTMPAVGAGQPLNCPQWCVQILAIPSCPIDEQIDGQPEISGSTVIIPQHSAAPSTDTSGFLYPWSVEGICLDPMAAFLLLNSLPLGGITDSDSFLAGDLRYWSHIARWSLDLLARSKFLPGLESLDQGTSPNAAPRFLACWQPLLDSGIDQSRLNRFLEQMPAACRFYNQGMRHQAPDPEKVDRLPANACHGLLIDLPVDPPVLLQNFLSQVLDAQVREIVKSHPLQNFEKATRGSGKAPAGSAKASIIDAPVWDWLQALGGSPVLEADRLASLQTALKNWTAPLQQHGFKQSLFRTCLYLHPPQPGQTTWKLEYFLQAVDDPEFLVSASTIWNNPVERLVYRGRAITHPQETFLMGLGLASRLYPLIEPSLQEARPQFCSLEPLQAYDFLRSVAWRLQDSGLGVVMPPSLANQGGWANRLGLRIQAQTGKAKQGDRLGLQSLLNFRWELSIGGQTLSKEDFDRLVALNMPLVEINGEWVELRPQDIRAAQAFFASRKDQTALSLEDALRISTGDTQMIEKLPVISFEASGALQDLINTISGKRTLEPIPTPETFRGELRPYQSRGVGWLAFLEQWGLGACLADDMGLGKTIQLIAFLLHLKQQDALKAPTLLVCPTSVLGNWEREVKKFGPSLKVLQHHGDNRARGKSLTKAVQDKDLVITSYALIHRDLQDLQTIAWQGVVLDEAQNIKNSEAKQSQAVRQLNAQFRIALTGTPVENRLSELWAIMDFLNPGYLGPKNFFQRRFATPIERYGDTDSLKTLRSLVQPFILRRLKTDRDIIQDLPEKQEMAVFCGLTSEQAALYQNVVETSLEQIEATEGIQRKGIILALLVKLKQICNHPALFLKDEDKEQEGGTAEALTIKGGKDDPGLDLQPSAFQSRSGKLQRLQEMLEEVVLEGDRALIFTQFAEWGKLLKAHLERQMAQEVLFLYGSTPRKQREEMVDRFQHDPQGPRLFILSLKAGGVGLNLTRANHVFHFDRWWNPAVENQATDRVFRIGQTRNVQVHKFVCNGTLEEKIHDLIESKKALAENVIGAGESWLTELDTDNLRNLLLLDRSAILGEE